MAARSPDTASRSAEWMSHARPRGARDLQVSPAITIEYRTYPVTNARANRAYC